LKDVTYEEFPKIGDEDGRLPKLIIFLGTDFLLRKDFMNYSTEHFSTSGFVV
jgi:hypothetical protein